MKYQYTGTLPVILPTLNSPIELMPGQIFDSDEQINNGNIVLVPQEALAPKKTTATKQIAADAPDAQAAALAPDYSTEITLGGEN